MAEPKAGTDAESTDRIERQILLKAPLSRVWRALTHAEEFGKWFGVALEGGAFAPGQEMKGHITHPGYEHIMFHALVDRVQPQTLFSFKWHPYAIDPAVDYSNEPMTLVVFELSEVAGGTLLKLVESGFDQVPAARRAEAFRMNSGGWDAQMLNVEKHVGAA